MALSITTFGNGEILKSVFDAIAMCLNSQTGTLYTPLIRIGLILSILWASIFALFGDYVRVWGKAILPFIFIPPLLFVPTTTVYIHDVVSHYRDRVDNVPYGLAYLGHFVSLMGYEMTKQVDQVFSHPEDLKYHNSGFLMASNLIQQAKTFRITNEDVAENMRQFVCQCVALEAMLGHKYTFEDLRNSADLWSLVSAHPSPIRSFIWRSPHRTGERGNPPEIINCREGVRRFNLLWGGELERAKTVFGTKFFGFSNPVVAKQEFLRYLPLSYGFLSGLSKSADQILKQQMMIYSLIDGIEQKSVTLGNAPNFAVRRAYLQQRTTFETLGGMASETLMTLKAVLEAIAYASFIFVVPLAVLPFGIRMLLSWAQILVWLQLWAPLYAVLNFIMTSLAGSKSLGLLALSNSEGVTIASSSGLMNLHADMAAMAGYLAMSVPFLAIALVKGVESFVHMASHIGAVPQGAASQAAADAVTGNYNFGNVSEGNQQIANTTMLTHSQAASYRASTFQMVEGRADMTTMSDGAQVINLATSNLPVSLNIAETQSAQFSEMANKSYQKALNLSESSGKSLARSYRDMIDLSHTLTHGESMGDSVTQGVSSEQSKAVHKTAQLIEDFAKNNQVSTEKAATLFAEASVGGGMIFKGAAGGRGSLNAADQELFQKAKKYAEEQNFQNAVREAIQASQNLSHSLSDESSKRLSEGISKSYEKGMTQRVEASKSFNESESLNQQAMTTLAHSASINANYTQQFIEWLADQPADHVSGLIGRRGAIDIIAHSPKEVAAYAHKYGNQEVLLPKPIRIESKGVYHNGTDYRMLEEEALNAPNKEETKELFSSLSTRGKIFRQEVVESGDRNKRSIGEVSSAIKNQGIAFKQQVETQKEESVTKRVAQKGIDEVKKLITDGQEVSFDSSQKE